jgi:coenzyme F420-0:L-glutamate ligase / coenzyme F420-1:gamma-L-glutamate ligase
MPDLDEVIRGRRSIRKYQQKLVPREVVLGVLVEARWAPSAHNSQPWRFIVVEDPSVKRELAQRMADAWAADLVSDGSTVDEKTKKERTARFATAPALIVACLTMEGLRKFPDPERQAAERDLAVESLGAAMQTLLLVAHGAGLGGCWFCAPAFCKNVVRKVLKVPCDVEPSALVILGYPDENPQTPKKKPLNAYCYLDVWGNGLS